MLVGTLVWLFVHRILWGPFYQLPSFLWRWFVWPVLGAFLSVTGVYAPNAATSVSRSMSKVINYTPAAHRPTERETWKSKQIPRRHAAGRARPRRRRRGECQSWKGAFGGGR